MTHPVGLVTHNSSEHAWVLDLPGCIAGRRDVDGLAAALPPAIAEHVVWLRAHGEQIDASDGWDVPDKVDTSAVASTPAPGLHPRLLTD